MEKNRPGDLGGGGVRWPEEDEEALSLPFLSIPFLLF